MQQNNTFKIDDLDEYRSVIANKFIKLTHIISKEPQCVSNRINK